jgi:hypothetical protein
MIRRVGNNVVMFETLHLFRSTFMRKRPGVTRNDGCGEPGVPHEDGAFNACLKKTADQSLRVHFVCGNT